MSRRSLAISIAVVVILGLLLATRAFFVVRVDQYAIVTEFGDPINIIEDPGLYFIVPFVQKVKYLDKRIRGWDDTDRETKTGEKHPIEYTVFARWRILEPLKYYEAVGNVRNAHGHMDSIVSNEIQSAVRRHKIASIVRETGRDFQSTKSVDIDDIFSDFKDCDPSVNPEFNEILGDTVALLTKKPKTGKEEVKAMRSQVVHGILKVSNERLGQEFGIIVEDLHFKYLNYSPKVHDVIVNKIKSDRKQEIATYNEVGDECVGYIQGVTKREQGEIIGKADRLVREIDGKAIAEAIQIKSSAFESNPDFYRFIKTLELYERSMKGRTSMILSMDSPILSLMKDASVMGAVPKKALPKKKKALPKKEEKAPK